MILNSIFLHLEGRYFSPEMCLKLKDQSRHITYCIQRSLKDDKFFIENFNRIVIEPSLNATYEIYVNSSSVASISVEFDVEKFEKSTDEELLVYYVALIRDGLKKFNEKIKIPIDTMFRALDILVGNNFLDVWIYQEKISKRLKISAKLICSMNIAKFHLNLWVKKNDAIIFDGVILETPPDDISFHNKFKELIVNDSGVEVLSRIPKDEVLFKLQVVH